MGSDARHPLLGRLDVWVGTWETRFSVDGTVMARGRATFTWTPDGAFLLERDETTVADGADDIWVTGTPRSATSVVGLDDAAERYSMLYADARDVFRVYQMAVEDDTWTIWRDAPEFNQRFVGVFDAVGRTVTGRWETSTDGSTWATDFDLVYTKLE